MAEKQRTLKSSISFQGKGLHTGVEVELTIHPAPTNHGYVFKRIDLPGQPNINAFAENVTDTSRGTTLEENGARVSTVEHVLSALAGMRLDNAIIDITGPETPILDGSAKAYVEAIEEAGIVEQNAERRYFKITEKLEYYDENNGVHIIAYPDKMQSINVLIDYNSDYLGNQYATLEQWENYK
ncbi:UDP-3-O-acyl-N-acetylglucosamine deacetylase, partial [Bacteroidota bacterium]